MNTYIYARTCVYNIHYHCVGLCNTICINKAVVVEARSSVTCCRVVHKGMIEKGKKYDKKI